MRQPLRQELNDPPTLWIVPPPDERRSRRRREPRFGERIAGRYRVLEVVGVGGMGVVYRVQDERLGLCVALKLLRPELSGKPHFVERFRREIVLARQVSHPNAVRIHDLGRDGDLLFLTMDFVPGRSLQALLREEGPLEPSRAEAIARQLALALAAAHAAGIVHRDLKPANVLIEDSGRACITDFGIARSLGASVLTRTGSVVGTLAYLSPEQARGEAVDARSDLYALGILLFEMLTGEVPFPGGAAREALARRRIGSRREMRPLPPEVPPRLAAIVRRLLERDPRRRFQSARELIDALDGGRRPALRLPRLALAAALLVAIGGATLPPLLWEHGGPAPPRPARAMAGPLHRVAVLPLADETGRADLAWVSAGLTEMLTDALGESPQLRVVSSARVAETVQDLDLRHPSLAAGDLRRIADLLGADRLITGRVRSPDGRLRVDLDVVSSDLAGLPAAALHGEEASAGELIAIADSLGRALLRRLDVEAEELPRRGAI